MKSHVCISVSATSSDWHQGDVLPHQWHAFVSNRERPYIYTKRVSERTIQTAGGGERDLCLCVPLCKENIFTSRLTFNIFNYLIYFEKKIVNVLQYIE